MTREITHMEIGYIEMTPLIDARVIQGHFQLWHKVLDFRVYLLTCFHPSDRF